MNFTMHSNDDQFNSTYLVSRAVGGGGYNEFSNIQGNLIRKLADKELG